MKEVQASSILSPFLAWLDPSGGAFVESDLLAKGFSVKSSPLMDFLRRRKSSCPDDVDYVIVSLQAEFWSLPVIACPCLDGSMVGLQEIRRAARDSQNPTCVRVQAGKLSSKYFAVSDALAHHELDVVEIFRLSSASAASKWKVLSGVGEVKKEYRSWKTKHGDNLRPWCRYRILVRDCDFNVQRAKHAKKYPNLVCTVESFLTDVAPPVRGSALPGLWSA